MEHEPPSKADPWVIKKDKSNRTTEDLIDQLLAGYNKILGLPFERGLSIA